MANLDVAALTAVLKQKYEKKAVQNICYPDNPLYAMMPKNTDFDGLNKVIALQYGNPQGRGISIASAQAGKTPSAYGKFTLTRKTDYTTASITGEAIRASKKDTGALIKGLSGEIDSAYYTTMRSLAIAMYRNGGGARGQISSTSNVGTATITLANIADITNFEVGMKLSASADDGTGGGSLRSAGAVVTITGMDEDLGTLTASGNWSAGIAAVAAGDYLFQNGGAAATLTSDYNAMVSGVLAWVPTSAPGGSDNFYGLNRSVSATRLAGVRYNGGGGPIEETLIAILARIARMGGKTTHAFMNPLDFEPFERSLGTRVVYDRVKSFDNPDIGFSSIRIIGPKGPVQVVIDQNCPKGFVPCLQMNTWAVEGLGEMPGFLDEDGLMILRSSNSDDYEVRVGYYGNISCNAPGYNGVAVL
jgi:hypothetical protein